MLKTEFQSIADNYNQVNTKQSLLKQEANAIYYDSILAHINLLAKKGKYQYTTKAMRYDIKDLIWDLAKLDGFHVKECGFLLRKLCINWQGIINANWFPGD